MARSGRRSDAGGNWRGGTADVSELHVGCDCHHGEEAGRVQLLALPGVRRNLEPVAPADAPLVRVRVPVR